MPAYHRRRDTAEYTSYAGNGPQVMATLRNIAISLLHLAGITQINRTLQATSRDPGRVLGLSRYRQAPVRLCRSCAEGCWRCPASMRRSGLDEFAEAAISFDFVQNSVNKYSLI